MNQYIEVLLVEDDDIDAEMTIRALKQNNLANQLLHVKDGDHALDFIFGKGVYEGRQVRNIPKIVLLDIKLPRVGGKEVLREMKADPLTNRIPVVMLTAYREDPDIKECYALGASAYVVKPVEFDEFHKVISNIGLYWMIVNEPPV